MIYCCVLEYKTNLRPRLTARSTYTQHCLLVLGPPNLGLSRQLMHLPQSSSWRQPLHWPQRRACARALRNLGVLCSCITGLSGSECDSTSVNIAWINIITHQDTHSDHTYCPHLYQIEEVKLSVILAVGAKAEQEKGRSIKQNKHIKQPGRWAYV